MNRKEAMSIVSREAFAENGLVMCAHNGDDPGFPKNGETNFSPSCFLTDELASKSNSSEFL